MKLILLSSVLVATLSARVLANSPVEAAAPESMREAQTLAYVHYEAACEQVEAARSRWDAAVADGHPVLAGTWARKHLAAMQARSAAWKRLQTATNRVNATRFAAR